MPVVKRDQSGAVKIARTPLEKKRRKERQLAIRAVSSLSSRGGGEGDVKKLSKQMKAVSLLLLEVTDALPKTKRAAFNESLLETVREAAGVTTDDNASD